MKLSRTLSGLLLAASVVMSSAQAAEPAPRVNYLATPSTFSMNGLQLAQASTSEGGMGVTAKPGTGEEEVFDEPLFTSNKMHKWLGISSLGLAALAGIWPTKEEDGPHEYLAQGAAFLGGAAVASGLVIHWDDIEFSNGWSDPDNLHALLTTLGFLGYALAVSQAPDGGHAGAGGLGFVSMAIGIKMTW
jgi:hypothetical protein